MRKKYSSHKIIFYLFFFLFLSIDSPIIFAKQKASFPLIKGFVNDYTHTLSPPFKTSLEQKLKEYEKQTSNQLVVAIFNSLEGQNLENYSTRLFNHWGIGKKYKNNGVALIFFMQDRKVRLEVGRGLEEKLNHEKSQAILNGFVTPSFKEARYEEGIRLGVDKIIETLK